MVKKVDVTMMARNSEDNEVIVPIAAEEAEQILTGDVEVSVETDLDDSLDDEAVESSNDTYTSDVIPLEAEKLPQIRKTQEVKVSGRRKTLDYGGESRREKRIRTYRALEAAKTHGRIIEGYIVGGTMEKLANGLRDALFQVIPTGEFSKNIEDVMIYIPGEKMTPVIQWNRLETDKEKYVALKDMFRKAMNGARIQFCIDDIVVENPEEYDIAERQYWVSGNRIMANEMIKEIYFDPNDPDSIREGDIVNGVILAVFTKKLLFHVAGIDLFINHTRVPYITGVKRISETISGKTQFLINEEKDCMIAKIVRNEDNNEIRSLRTSFYEPLKGELMKKIEAMSVGGIYTATVLRYLELKGDGSVRIIVKTDSGVEVLCDPPNWRVPPKEMDTVKVKIIRIVADTFEEATVIGHIKR